MALSLFLEMIFRKRLGLKPMIVLSVKNSVQVNLTGLNHPSAGRVLTLFAVIALSVLAPDRVAGAKTKTVSVDAGKTASANVDWPLYGLDHAESRFSPLKQINATNVSELGVAWTLPLPDAGSLVATPLVVNGVMYFSTEYSRVFAVDAKTGKVIWKFDPEVAKDAGQHLRALANNKGVAYWEGRVYVGTVDGRLIALDASTGSQSWEVQTRDSEIPRNIGGAPRVFNGKVIIGHGGADFYAIRGYVTAYDAVTGEQAWRFYLVPGNPADGFENSAMEMAAETWNGQWWKHGGGGTAWNAMTYDPEFNRIYIGTGNGSPWNRRIRSPGGGDNLFLCSVVALDADTGEYVWHYQTSPGEAWDYNSVMDMVLSDAVIDGKTRKVMLHAPKNGFCYVIDRADGALISAEKFAPANWAERIDLKTGRPIETPIARYKDAAQEIWPGTSGAHNWQPMSYNPQTGLVYIPTTEKSSIYSDQGIDHKSWKARNEMRLRGSSSSGLGGSGGSALQKSVVPNSYLQAWDPISQKQVWRVDLPSVNNGGTLTTAGNLVLQGAADGEFSVYAANDGSKLWSHDVGWGISAAPMTYRIDGEQYIALGVGWGAMAARAGHDASVPNTYWAYNQGISTMVVYRLGGDQAALVNAKRRGAAAPFSDQSVMVHPDLYSQGKRVYGTYCGYCHGKGLASGGGAPDLKASTIAAYEGPLKTLLHQGLLQAKGMPIFDEITNTEVRALHSYIRITTREKIKTP